MKIFSYLALSMAALMPLSAGAQNTRQFPATRANEYALVYSLPTTAVDITIETEHVHRVPGEFHNYARRHLAITDAITEESTTVSVRSITIATRGIADTSNQWQVQFKNGAGVTMLLTADGRPLTINTEEAAQQWITTSPDAFCNTTDADTLRQVLNDYDQTTADFFRWPVKTTAHQLGCLIKEKSGRDIGDVVSLEPLRRGESGRISRLRIVGTCGELTVGKELEIRRILSPTHLYSSAFVAEVSADGSITLRGAGWGHGVGLCQIGAAVMARRRFSYRSILYHYFRRAIIERAW